MAKDKFEELKIKVQEKIDSNSKKSLETTFKEKVFYWQRLYWQVPNNIWNDIRIDSKEGFLLLQKFFAENKSLVMKANGNNFNVIKEFQIIFKKLVSYFGLEEQQSFKSKILRQKLKQKPNYFGQILFKAVKRFLEGQLDQNDISLFLQNQLGEFNGDNNNKNRSLQNSPPLNAFSHDIYVEIPNPVVEQNCFRQNKIKIIIGSIIIAIIAPFVIIILLPKNNGQSKRLLIGQSQFGRKESQDITFQNHKQLYSKFPTIQESFDDQQKTQSTLMDGNLLLKDQFENLQIKIQEKIDNNSKQPLETSFEEKAGNRMDFKQGFPLFQQFLAENKPLVMKANDNNFNVMNGSQTIFKDLASQFSLQEWQKQQKKWNKK